MKLLTSLLIGFLLSQSALAANPTGSAYQILRIPSPAGPGVGKFGSIDLSQSGAVGSSILGKANGGTGLSSPGSSGNGLLSDGTDWKSYPVIDAKLTRNVGAKAAVSSNALTISMVQSDGSSDCTSSAPCTLGFRSSTASNGGFSVASVTSSLSIVVPSTATLGHVSGVAENVYLYAINNAGTIELAVTGRRIVNETSLVTTVAISTSALDGYRIFSTTQRTNVAIRFLAKLSVTEATAGTWATAPSEIALNFVPKPVWRLSDAIIGGTGRVTGSAPTAIGEYRSYLRQAGASTWTETNGTPSPTPSAANGIFIKTATLYSSADATGEPSRYDLYIGKDKTYQILTYSSTGRTGNYNRSRIVYTTVYEGGTLDIYDPTTGVLQIYLDTSHGNSNPRLGFNGNNGFIQSGYFDVLVFD